ncbi:MAG: hypothetical protein JWR35_1418 [Marmoricola sp.]|nr:hypothetical protein [Marmoricola sp.]
MYRALGVLRFVVLLNAIGLYLLNHDGFPHAQVGAAVLVVMSLWTAVAVWAYDVARRRGVLLLAIDLAVSLGALLLTPYVKGPGWESTLPGFWVMGAVLAWAIHYRWLGGLVAAVLVNGTDLLIRPDITRTTYGNVFLLLLGGPIVGFLSALLQQMSVERDRAERAAAAAAERQRLSRVVHDGVLQVLALVQRRGTELGGEAAELGKLAGEQEVALRTFVQHDTHARLDLGGERDLGEELSRLETASVSIALPGEPFPVPAAVALEVADIVGACLSNVRHHVGADAPAWVLLEDLGATWTVSVRDDGPGIPEGRLEDAVRDGRLGVAQSIQGRVADLGGTSELVTGPGLGTEWDFTFPKASQ